MSGNGQKGYISKRLINLNCNPMRNCWCTKMQDYFGKIMLDIGDEVLEENFHIEMGLSFLNEKGKGPFW
jgi:hypothetical protein